MNETIQLNPIREPPTEPLDATVNLREGHVRSVLLPTRTLLCELALIRQHNRVLCFEELDAQTLGDVPCNMAMHEPSTRVVGRESKNKPARSRQSGCVSARRVDEVELVSHGRRVEV